MADSKLNCINIQLTAKVIFKIHLFLFYILLLFMSTDLYSGEILDNGELHIPFQTLQSVMSPWESEMGHGGSMHTMETGKCYQSGLLKNRMLYLE